MSKQLAVKLRIDASGNVQGVVKDINTDLKQFETQSQAATAQTDKLASSLKRAGAYAAAAFSVSKLIGYANGWTDLNSRVLNATGSQEDAIVVMEAVTRTARNTYSSLNQTAEAYLNNAMTLTELGYSTARQIELSEALNNALVISGTKAQQAESVMNALSKAIALGELRGDNFNTVIQSGGRVVQALADGLSVTTLELRAMAETGELTTGRFVEALTSQLIKLRKEADAMPATVGDATLLMGNSIAQLVGRFNDASGAAAAVADPIIGIADRIDGLSESLSAGDLDGHIDNITTAATLLSIAVGARLTAALTVATAAKVRGSIEAMRYQAALASMAGVSQTTALRMTALGVATTTASRAMALLGGPVGVVTLAAGSVYAFRTELGLVKPNALNAGDAIEQLTQQIDSLTAAQARQRLEQLAEPYQEALHDVRVYSAQVEGLKIQLEKFPRNDGLRKRLIDAEANFDSATQVVDKYKQALAQLNHVSNRPAKTDEPAKDSPYADIFDPKYVEAEQKSWIASLREFHAEIAKELDADAKAKKDLIEQQALMERKWRAQAFIDQRDLTTEIDHYEVAVTSLGDAWTRTGNQALDAMGSMMSMMSTLAENEQRHAQQMAEVNRLRAENDAKFAKGSAQWRVNDAKLTEQQLKLDKQRISQSVTGSANMLAAASAMYKEGSKEQKLAHQASLALHAIDLAMKMKEAIANATVATTAAGALPPPLGFASVAAMAAMMGGVLSNIGASFSSGGASAGYSAVPISKDGGILSGEESNSLANTTQLLIDINADQYRELRGINQGIKNLNASAEGTVRSLYSAGDIARLSANPTASSVGNADFMFDVGDKLGKIPLGLGVISGGAANLMGNIGNTIFGGTKKTSTDYGLSISGTLGDLDVGGYETIKTKKNGGWFGRSSTSYADHYKAVSGDTQDMLQSVFANIGSSMIEVGQLLDMDVAKAVSDFGIDVGKISLKGSADDVQKSIEQAINSQSDKLANELFGDMTRQYQKLNEGMFETLSRLAIEKVVAEDILAMTGQGVGTQMQARVELGERSWFGRRFKIVREEVEADAIAVTQSLVEIAGGLEALQDAASNYYDKFFSDEEKAARNREQLIGSLNDQNLVLPGTRDEYRALVESLNLGSESAREQYVTLLNVSSLADEYYAALESAEAKRLADAESSIAAQKRLEDDLTKVRLSALNSLLGGLTQAKNVIMGTLAVDSVGYISAQADISAALASARDGLLPNFDAIKDALGAVSRNSMDNYATYADFAFDQAYTAAMIGELAGYTENQISIEEQMLNSALDQTDLLKQIRDGIYMGSTGGYVSTPIPGFATGGIHSGGWRIVGENGPELEFTQPSRIFNNNQTGKMLDNTDLANELRAIKAELAALRQQDRQIGIEMIKASRETSDTLERWDAVGLPSTGMTEVAQ